MGRKNKRINMNTNNEKVQAATLAMNEAIDDYRIEDGIAKGLINQEEIDDAIIDAMSAFCKEYISTPNKITSLATEDVVRRAFTQLTIELRDCVFTGNKKRIENEDDGTVTWKPIKTSTRAGINYYDTIIKKVMERLMNNWQPKTPTLEHEPDAVRFLEICKDLFPNVTKPHVAANALREFIENVHHSCGTEKAHFEQKALWLYSLKTGGTGKSFFMGLLKQACDRLGIDASYENFQESGYLNPTIGMHTVTISEDTPKLDKHSAEVMNKLIDRSVFPFNIKWGAQGQAQSVANLVLGSNYVSFESNIRRYNEVEYIQCNLKTALTKQDREEYFPLWNNEEKGVEEIIEAFKVCPFQCELEAWEKPSIKKDLFGEEEESTFEVDDRYLQTVIEIKETIMAHKDDEYATGDISKMTPTAFARQMVKYNKLNYKEALGSLKSFITEMKSNGKLPSRNCMGRCKIELFTFNWNTLADMIPSTAETESNFLANIRDEWNNLINETRKTELDIEEAI